MGALRRDFRLRTGRQFAYLWEHSRSGVGELCVVRAVPPPAGDHRRVAFVVSRRYSRKAVDRNRARRLLRETYRLLLPELGPVWLVFMPRHRAARAKCGAVYEDARQVLQRLGLLSGAAGALPPGSRSSES